MVLGRKTNFFLGKTKNQKKTYFETLCGQTPKRLFFFPLEKDSFSRQNHLFPRKKLVFHAQTIFFLGKSWFSCPKPFFQEKVGFPVQNHLFPRKKLVFLSKTIFFLGKTKENIFPHSVSKDGVFGFLVFPRKKLVFLPKTIFFLGKNWFSCPEPSFS